VSHNLCVATVGIHFNFQCCQFAVDTEFGPISGLTSKVSRHHFFTRLSLRDSSRGVNFTLCGTHALFSDYQTDHLLESRIRACGRARVRPPFFAFEATRSGTVSALTFSHPVRNRSMILGLTYVQHGSKGLKAGRERLALNEPFGFQQPSGSARFAVLIMDLSEVHHCQ
jgi:hypothetical protein